MTDYRGILEEEFVSRNLKNPRMSRASFARHLGLSPGRLHDIMAGKQGLSPVRAKTIVRKLKLIPARQKIFILSVQALHERSPKQRLINQKSLEHFKKTDKFKTLEDQKDFSLLDSWIYVALVELTHLSHFIYEPNSLAEVLEIKASEVSRAMDLLIKLGYIKLQADQKICPGDSFASSDGVPSQKIRSFHKQMMSKALISVEQQNVSKRHLSANVMAINTQDVPVVRTMMADFRRKVDEYLSRQPIKDRVYCLNMQFFDLTHGLDKKEDYL